MSHPPTHTTPHLQPWRRRWSVYGGGHQRWVWVQARKAASPAFAASGLDRPPPPALAPAVAERLAGAAASLADAAAELKRRACLADAGLHCATVGAARARADAATDAVTAGLAAIADEAAELLQVRRG